MAASDTQSSPNPPESALDALKGGWLAFRFPDRAGHSISYVGLLLFTAVLYFRPQDYSPALQKVPFALATAVFTLLFFVPTQILLEGRLTAWPREMKWLMLLCLTAILAMPLALNRDIAWATFNDQFIKVVAMFIVMINVVRTESRWKGLFWVSLAVALLLAATSINDFRTGNTPLEGYRVRGALAGMFADPNDLALFLVSVMPIAFALMLGERGLWAKLFYIACALIMLGGMIFTYSRGGFLGLSAAVAVLAYKLGRGRRLLVGTVALLLFVGFIVLAPGNYAGRLASIANPGLDETGSPAERQQLLFRSIEVAAAHPLFGVGMSNFPLYTNRGKPSHNAYTQVASEMGLAGLFFYLAFMVTALKYLRRIERETDGVRSYARFHYLSIGLQASLAGYMASSFFLSVAYYWVVYYLVGYAVCLRRVYETGPGRVLGRLAPAEAPERQI